MTELSRRGLFGAALVTAAGALAARAALADPAPVMPEVTHRVVEANGIRLHIAEQGSGPLVLLCHGFPECWYSWRHQLGALAAAGFHAVAPDLRGYGRSDRPEGDEKYTVIHHVGDMVGLLDALGAKDAVIAGHDVGATIAWTAALMRPDRFRSVIALAVPFRPRGFGSLAPPTSVMPQTKEAMFYQLYLATPEAETAMARDPRLTFRAMFSALSSGGIRPVAAGPVAAAGMVPRSGLPFQDPASLPPWLTVADVDVYAGEFTRSGFRGPLAWYRDIDLSWELMAPFAGAAQVTVPALYLAGKDDFLVAAFQPFIAQQPRLVPKLRPAVMLPGCGHWTQQERPADVNAAMIDFLRQA